MSIYSIQFDEEIPASNTPNIFKYSGKADAEFDLQARYWAMGYRSNISLVLTIDKPEDINMLVKASTFNQRPGQDEGLSVLVNNNTLITNHHFSCGYFRDVIITIPNELLESGDNNIQIVYYSVNNLKLYLSKIVVDIPSPQELSENVSSISPGASLEQSEATEQAQFVRPRSNADWMSGIFGYNSLMDVSIPGTHDSASINRVIKTPYACQDRTLTRQLECGIRMLDIRIKVKNLNGKDGLVTCHGDYKKWFIPDSMNEYQSLNSVFKECTAFLDSHSSELIVMTLKIDDWGICDTQEKKEQSLRNISALLSDYEAYLLRTSKMPSVDQARKKIYLLNRINANSDFGAELSIPYNTPGILLDTTTTRDFKVYVQDKCDSDDDLDAHAEKLACVISAIHQKQRGILNLNFVSGNAHGFGVYVADKMLNALGPIPQSKGRPWILGWLLFDYPFLEYATGIFSRINAVDFIIDANYSYPTYGNHFKIVESIFEL
jgi:hypothetical protein